VSDGPAAGTTDLAALERMLADPDHPVGGVVVANPSFFGLLEPMAEIGRLAHAAGALFVAVVEPVSLAVLATPGEYGADIAAGDGQPLGIPLSVRRSVPRHPGLPRGAGPGQIPGRLVGMTTDVDGKRAFVMTLRAREQDIRREKAASNICTNQALCALAATIYLGAMGPHGLRDVAALGAARAAELEAAALAAAGAPRSTPGRTSTSSPSASRTPRGPRPPPRPRDPGRPAARPSPPDDPPLADALLVCATEVTTPAEIAAFAAALGEELAGGAPMTVAGDRLGTHSLRALAARAAAAARCRIRPRTRWPGSRPAS
jgi:glycine dehydrogenase subunit 1